MSFSSDGSVAERSKVLVKSTSLLGGVGLNSTAAKIIFSNLSQEDRVEHISLVTEPVH